MSRGKAVHGLRHDDSETELPPLKRRRIRTCAHPAGSGCERLESNRVGRWGSPRVNAPPLLVLSSGALLEMMRSRLCMPLAFRAPGPLLRVAGRSQPGTLGAGGVTARAGDSTASVTEARLPCEDCLPVPWYPERVARIATDISAGALLNAFVQERINDRHGQGVPIPHLSHSCMSVTGTS